MLWLVELAGVLAWPWVLLGGLCLLSWLEPPLGVSGRREVRRVRRPRTREPAPVPVRASRRKPGTRPAPTAVDTARVVSR